MALSRKQLRFAEEYVKCFNAAKAARQSGYSEKTARFIGAENLTKPNIQARIKELLDELKMSADEVLTRLAEQARSEHGKYINESGQVDLAALIADDKAHLIHKVKQTKYGPEIEFYDAQSALVHIGRNHGLFVDKLALTDPSGENSIIPDAEAIKSIAEIFKSERSIPGDS